MSYIRVRRHYLPVPYLVLGIIEICLLIIAAHSSQVFLSNLGELFPAEGVSGSAWIFAIVLTICTASMGVYPSLVREGFFSMLMRTFVSYCFLGVSGLIILGWLFPSIGLTEQELFWSILASILLVSMARGIFTLLTDSNALKRNVLVLGAGKSAEDIRKDYEKDKLALNFRIAHFMNADQTDNVVPDYMLHELPEDWVTHCKERDISEIVIAMDDRRRNSGARFPLEDLLKAKLAGIQITDAISFIEREFNKVSLPLLQISWLLLSDATKPSKSRYLLKRGFDISICLVLLFFFWPFMLATAIAVALESGRPVLYSQERVGLHGKTFRIFKFRSMRTDAEKDGKAKWATANDSRVTRVGKFIRNTRLDELPQIYNVIVGDMSFVGPRPERPQFVEELCDQIPFYDKRHVVKPGLMGWAQINYPYGASVEDAKNKLEYDLYYTKNYSWFMDLLIIVQTVEIVLLGKGVR